MPDSARPMRLDQLLSRYGYCSRKLQSPKLAARRTRDGGRCHGA